MSLNIINEVEIKALSKTLMDIVKDEEKIQYIINKKGKQWQQY